MAAIAAEAGITKPVIYRVFADKSVLYQALADRHTERLLVVMRNAIVATHDRLSRTRAVIEGFLTVIEEQTEIYRFLVHQASDPAIASAVQGFIHRFGIELGQGIAYDLGQPADSPTAQIWGAAMIGGVQSAAERWLEDPMGMSRGDLAQSLTDLFAGYASLSDAAPTDR